MLLPRRLEICTSAIRPFFARVILGAGAICLLASSCASGPAAKSTARDQLLDVDGASALVRASSEAPLVEYPWGWIRWLMSSEIDPEAEMTFGIVHVEAQQLNPFHLHSNCEEYLYVISGSCEHRIGDEWVTLKEGDLVRIPKGVSHMARTRDEPMRAVIAYSAATRDFTVVEEDQD